MIIYLITNTNNGKQYVGQTINGLTSRWTQHRVKARTGLNRPLYNSIRKHGFSAFTVEQIARFDDMKTLNTAEKLFISELNTKVPNGYNRTDGGEGVSGLKFSKEVRARMSAKKKGRPAWNKGKSPTPEAEERRLASRKAGKGYTRTPEMNAKTSRSLQGRGGHSPEAIARQVASRRAGKGWSPCQETKDKISKTLKQRNLNVCPQDLTPAHQVQPTLLTSVELLQRA